METNTTGLLRGQKIFYNTGEVSFESDPRSAGTFQGVFLEEMPENCVKILDKRGTMKVTHNTLIPRFNI